MEPSDILRDVEKTAGWLKKVAAGFNPETAIIAGSGLGGALPRLEGKVSVSYQDIPGFCKSVKIEEIRAQGYVLTPGRYVGAEEVEDDDEPFEKKMARLTAQLREQMEEAKKLDEAIWKNLEDLGYGK